VVVGLIADRMVPELAARDGREAELLGGRRVFPAAGMDLARRAGAALLPIFLLRERGGYVIRIHPPLPVAADPAAAFAAALAGELRERPEQWCMLFPLHDAGQARGLPQPASRKGAAAP
jgi:lauroyl/myristoyl acyltransferase